MAQLTFETLVVSNAKQAGAIVEKKTNPIRDRDKMAQSFRYSPVWRR